jgi:hypothetical protein
MPVTHRLPIIKWSCLGFSSLPWDHKPDLTNRVSTHGIIIKTGTMTDRFHQWSWGTPLGFPWNCPPNTWVTVVVIRLCPIHSMIKDANVTTIRTLQHIKAESCTKWYQPFHNAVLKQRSHKIITLIETNQYVLANIWCATGNSVTFLDQNKTMSVHAEPPKCEGQLRSCSTTQLNPSV